MAQVSAKISRINAKAPNFGKNAGRKVADSTADLLKFLKKEFEELVEAIKSGEFVQWLKKKFFEFIDDVDELVKIAKKKPRYGKIYRVQGGEKFPNFSKYRFFIKNKKVFIEGEDMIHVTFDDTYRVAFFWTKRGDKAEVFSADILEEFILKISKDAVPQEYGSFSESSTNRRPN